MLDFDFEKIVSTFRRDVVGSILTSLLLMFYVSVGYVGYHLITTGGSFADLFITSQRLADDRKAAQQQQQLVSVTKSNVWIEDTLRTLLEQFPNTVRARVSVVHNGSYITASQIPLLKWDTMWSKAARGFDAGPMTSNNAMSLWNDFLGDLIDGKCVLQTVPTLASTEMRSRFESLRVAAFAVCPIRNAKQEILGALFISWDNPNLVPTDTVTLFAAMRLSAAQIAGYLLLRSE